MGKKTEAEMRAKYPLLKIKEGSLGWDPTAGAGSGKQHVTLICSCGVEVRRYTSDLFTFKGCPVCKAKGDKVREQEKRATERAAMAAYNANKAVPAPETTVPAIGN